MIQLGEAAYDFILNMSGFRMSAQRIQQELNAVDQRVQRSLDNLGSRSLLATQRVATTIKTAAAANAAAARQEVAANKQVEASKRRILEIDKKLALENQKLTNDIAKQTLAQRKNWTDAARAYEKSVNERIVFTDKLEKAERTAALSRAAAQHQYDDLVAKKAQGTRAYQDALAKLAHTEENYNATLRANSHQLILYDLQQNKLKDDLLAAQIAVNNANMTEERQRVKLNALSIEQTVALKEEVQAERDLASAREKTRRVAEIGAGRINAARGRAAQLNKQLSEDMADQERKLTAGAERVEDMVNRHLRNAQTFAYRLRDVGQNVQDTGRNMLLGVGVVFAGFAAVAKQGVEMNTSIQLATEGFKTLTGSVDTARRFVKAIRNEAIGSLLTFKELLPISQRLASAYGPNNLGRVLPTIRAVGDVAAIRGASVDDQGRAFQAISNMLSSGKISQRFVQQISRALRLNVNNILKELYGSIDTKELTKRGIGPEKFIADLVRVIEKGPMGGSQVRLMRSTLPGIFSAIKDSWNDMTAGFTKDIQTKLITALNHLFDSLEHLRKNPEALATIQKAFNSLGDAVSGVLSLVTRIIDAFAKMPPAQQEAVLGLALFAVKATALGGALLFATGWVIKLVANVALMTLAVRQFAPAAEESAVETGGMTKAVSLLNVEIGTASTMGLVGRLGLVAAAAAAAFAGWKIGTWIDQVFDLSGKLAVMWNQLRGIKEEGEGGRGSELPTEYLAVQALRRGASFDPKAYQEGEELTGHVNDWVASSDFRPADQGLAESWSRRVFKLPLKMLTPAQRNTLAGMISADKHARDARFGGARKAGDGFATSPPTAPDGAAMGIGGSGVAAGGVPRWMQYMNADVGRNIGKECGAALTEYLTRVGVHKSASALAQQAYDDKKFRVSAIGRDAKGAPIFPNGTMIFIPGKQGYGAIGRDAGEHFAATYYDRKKNLSMLLESTSAGHKGSWTIRNDRTFAGAVGDRDYMAFGTKLPPEEAAYRREQRTEARRAATERRKTLREAEAERKRVAAETRRSYMEGLSAQTARLYSGADEATANGDYYGAATKKTQAKKFEAQAKVLRHLYDHSSWTWMTDGMVSVLQEFVQAVDTADAQGAKLLDVAAKKTGLHFKETFLTAIDNIGSALADSGSTEQEQLQGRITMGRGIMNLPTFGDLPKTVQDKIAAVVRGDEAKLLAAKQEQNYSDLQEQIASMTEDMDANGKSQEDQWAAINTKVDLLLGADAKLPEGQRSFSPNVASRLRRESSLRTTRINRARVSGVLSDAEAARSTMESDMETAGKTRSDILVALRDHIKKEIDTLSDDVAVTDDQRQDLMVKLEKANAAIALHEKELATYRAKRVRDIATERMSPEMRERYGKADDIQDKAAEDYKKDKEANVPGADAEYNKMLKRADRLRHLSVWQDVADTAKAKFVSIQDSFADAIGNIVANGGKLRDWWKSTWRDMEKEVVSVVIKNILISFLKMVGIIKSPKTGLAGGLAGALGGAVGAAAPGAGGGGLLGGLLNNLLGGTLTPVLAGTGGSAGGGLGSAIGGGLSTYLGGAAGGTPPFVAGAPGGILAKLGLGKLFGGLGGFAPWLPLILGGIPLLSKLFSSTGIGGLFKGVGGVFKGIGKGIKHLFHFDDPVNDFNAAHSGRDFTRQWLSGINQGMAQATVSAMSRQGGFADMLAERSAFSAGGPKIGMVRPGGDTIVHESHVHSPIILDRNNQRQLNDLLQRTDAEQQLLRVRRGSYSGRDRKY